MVEKLLPCLNGEQIKPVCPRHSLPLDRLPTRLSGGAENYDGTIDYSERWKVAPGLLVLNWPDWLDPLHAIYGMPS